MNVAPKRNGQGEQEDIPLPWLREEALNILKLKIIEEKKKNITFDYLSAYKYQVKFTRIELSRGWIAEFYREGKSVAKEVISDQLVDNYRLPPLTGDDLIDSYFATKKINTMKKLLRHVRYHPKVKKVIRKKVIPGDGDKTT